VERESSANCDREVATDRWASTTESREADRSRASGPPLFERGQGEPHAANATTGG
jgi:hypothetical protein